jgi:predicted MFS family arabinose efflux permease
LASAIGAAAGGWAMDGSGLSLGWLLGLLGAFTLLPGLLWTFWLRRHQIDLT